MVEQGDNLALEVGGSINDEKSLTAKGAQSDNVFRSKLRFTINAGSVKQIV